MGRPRKNERDSAVSRMEAAFFTVMEETPYEKLTVRAIVAAAGVNRNSFYYHYRDLDELARSAVGNLLIPEIPSLIVSGFEPGSEQIEQVFARELGTERLGKVFIIMGPNSTSELRGMLKNAVLELWLQAFQIGLDDLGPRDAVTVQFFLAGILDLLGGIEEPNPEVVLRELSELPIVRATMRIAVDTLTTASQRTAPGTR